VKEKFIGALSIELTLTFRASAINRFKEEKNTVPRKDKPAQRSRSMNFIK